MTRPHGRLLDQFLTISMEPVLADRLWLADYPACRGYVARAMARPAFAKAHADQMAHFAAAD